MELRYKPDLEDARRHWDAFWAGQIIDRPCLRVVSPRSGVEQAPHPPGLHHPHKDPLAHVHAFDRFAATTYFGADAVPFFYSNYGPDIFSAFLGAELEFNFEHSTSWAKPFVEDWDTDGAALDHPHGFWWEEALKIASEAHKIADGKFAIGVLDLHSNLDCLAAVRGPQRLCMDLLDQPDAIDSAMKRVRKAYAPIFDAFYEASGERETGCLTWLPMYCSGKFAAIQCDFICMISPEHLRRFVVPALEEEARFLDHCVYHYDGPDALVHLHDILSIKGIDTIQWTPGAGNPPLIEWMDLLKKMQDYGKSLYIAASIDEVKVYHKELRPEKVMYDVWAPSETDANALIDWLVKNT